MFQKEFMGSQKLKVCFRFQTTFAIGIITYHMCKNIGIRIVSGFCPIIIYFCLRQDLAVSRQNLSPDNPIRKSVLSCIVGAVDKTVTFYSVKINQISDKTCKDQYKENRYKSIFFVFGTPSFRSGAFCLLPLLLGFSELLLFFSSQILRPHLLLKYTIPE